MLALRLPAAHDPTAGTTMLYLNSSANTMHARLRQPPPLGGMTNGQSATCRAHNAAQLPHHNQTLRLKLHHHHQRHHLLCTSSIQPSTEPCTCCKAAAPTTQQWNSATSIKSCRQYKLQQHNATASSTLLLWMGSSRRRYDCLRHPAPHAMTALAVFAV